MDKNISKNKDLKDLVAAMAEGIRVHAAVRGQNVTLCGHNIVTVGASKGSTAVDCRLCSKIAGESKVVLRPRAR